MISCSAEPQAKTLSLGLFAIFFFLFNRLPLRKSRSNNLPLLIFSGLEFAFAGASSEHQRVSLNVHAMSFTLL